MDAFIPVLAQVVRWPGVLRRQGWPSCLFATTLPPHRKLNSDSSTKQGSRKVSDQNR